MNFEVHPSATATLTPTPDMVAAGRTLAEPRLSPDGLCVVFHVRDAAGSRLVRIDLFDGPDQALARGPEEIVTCDPPIVGVHPSGGGSWDFSSDGSFIVYAARSGLYWVDRRGGPGRQIVACGDALYSPVVSPDNNHVAYVVESNVGQAIWVAAIDCLTPPVCVAAADSAVFRYDPVWGALNTSVSDPTTTPSPASRFALNWQEWSVPHMAWDASRIGGSLPEAFAKHAYQSPSQVRWSPSGNRLGVVDDGTGWRVVTVDGMPVVDEPHEHATPTWGAGQRSWCWSPDGTAVAFVRNEQGFGRLCAVDLDSGSLYELGRAWHLGLSWASTPSGMQRIAAIRTGGVTPAQLVVYQFGNLSEPATRTTIARGPVSGWEACDLPEPLIVEWPATDGTTLFGRLYLPKQRAATTSPPPVIVSIHGGPTDQTTVQFNARYAYWLTRGIAVFVPDYRGSSGHGRAYQQAMNGLWGERDVDDIASALDWLRSADLVDSKRMVLIGGSAGGFSVLHVLARPELTHGIVGAVVLYPVTDLASLDATTHRFERHYNTIIVGPSSRYTDRSPIRHAARIRTPLLMLQGDADPVVSVDQSRSLVRAITEAGGSVDYIEYPGEGHGWKNATTIVDELRHIDEFIAAVCT